MLFIPLPLALRVSMPWKQKLVLVFILGLGVFVIVAALLTKVFNLTNVWDPVYMLWYVREASVAMYVSNLPMIWPLLRDWFPCLRKLTPGGASSYGRSGLPGGPASGGALEGSGGKGGKHMELSSMHDGSRRAAGGSRVRGGTSTARDSVNTLDFVYDVERGYGTSGSKTHGRGGGRVPSVDGGSSTEGIMPHQPSSEGDTVPRKQGGIQVLVERTVVVHEERHGHMGDEKNGQGAGVDNQIYDWSHSGAVENHTAVVSKR